MVFYDPRLDPKYRKCPTCARLLTAYDYDVPRRQCTYCYIASQRKETNGR